MVNTEYPYYIEDVKQAIFDRFEIVDLASELYNRPDNFNNADPSSGQKVLTLVELENVLEDISKQLLDEDFDELLLEWEEINYQWLAELWELQQNEFTLWNTFVEIQFDNRC